MKCGLDFLFPSPDKILICFLSSIAMFFQITFQRKVSLESSYPEHLCVAVVFVEGGSIRVGEMLCFSCELILIFGIFPLNVTI